MIKCYVGSICQLHVFPPSGSYNGGGPKGGGSAGSPVHSRDILQPPRPLRTVDVASRAHSYYSPRPRTRTCTAVDALLAAIARVVPFGVR